MAVLEPRDEIDGTAERVLGEEVIQTPPRLGQANIGAESAESAQRQSRLFRIEFPRMEVDHGHPGLAIAERLAQTMPHDPQRQQPEIPPTSYGKIGPQETERRGGELKDVVLSALDEERRPGRLAYPIAIVSDGIDGRVVEQPRLCQDVDRPPGLLDHAEGRRSIAHNRAAGNLLERVLAPTQILQE